LLEYPHYTRPAVFQGRSVPEILLHGNHAEIQRWRRQEALKRTWKKRPDLLEKVRLSEQDCEILKNQIK
ncbi:MAG TPA: tRNA (guanosine(37)-N1)-methyltransferase TrmD, partial [Deltaproteobacteria bacterium]|nr:tRNA (guanosine(37)-N1)-methyltransferase TrmD [Deltaproteobacteria bacterium]